MFERPVVCTAGISVSLLLFCLPLYLLFCTIALCLPRGSPPPCLRIKVSLNCRRKTVLNTQIFLFLVKVFLINFLGGFSANETGRTPRAVLVCIADHPLHMYGIRRPLFLPALVGLAQACGCVRSSKLLILTD